MSAISEIARPRENQKSKEIGLVGEKAIQLWELIAPDRKPSSALKFETAVFLFHYVPVDNAPPKESFELNLFHSILKPYLQTEDVVFRAQLAINPNFFDHGKLDRKDAFSFILEIKASPPPQLPAIGWPTVFGLAEFPLALGVFNKKPQINILGESGFYTGDLSRVILGKPENLETSPFIPGTKATHKEAMLASNVEWRKKFTEEIVDRLISLAKEKSKEKHRHTDQAWQAKFRTAW